MSEKRQARFEQLRQTSKGRIENAALELFAHNGYGHTSISQIAKAAGISKGLMYNYYESKEALLKALLQRGFDTGDDMMAAGMAAAADDPKNLLTFIVEAAFAEVQANQKYWKLLMSLTFQEDVLKTIAPEIEQKKAEHIEMGKTIFEKLGYPNPTAQALFFGAALDGVFMHFILSPDDYPLMEVKELLIKQFLNK